MPSVLIQCCGLAAILGGALAVAIAPFINFAYSLTEDCAGTTLPREPALSDSLSPIFTFAAPDAVYAAYGKLYFFVSSSVFCWI